MGSNKKLKFEVDDPAQNRQTEALDALQEAIAALNEGQSIKVWPMAGVVGMDLAALKNTVRRYLRPRHDGMTVTQRSGEEFVRIAFKGKPRGRSAKNAAVEPIREASGSGHPLGDAAVKAMAEPIAEVSGDDYSASEPVFDPGPGTPTDHENMTMAGEAPGAGTEGDGDGQGPREPDPAAEPYGI